MTVAATPDGAVPVAPRVHWIGALDPDLRRFDIILRTANGTTYNAYAVRGSHGVAIIDTVKIGFSETFFRRLESIADYDEISTIVLNHLEPDHSGALPELLRRARRATLLVSPQARLMLKGLFDPADLAGRIAFVGSGDRAERRPSRSWRSATRIPQHAVPALAGYPVHLAGGRRGPVLGRLPRLPLLRQPSVQ